MRRLVIGAAGFGLRNGVGPLRFFCSHHLPCMEPSNDAHLISEIVLNHYNPFHPMEASLQLMGISFSSNLINQTLLRLSHNSKIALSFFHFCKSLPNRHRHLSSTSYNILIDSLSRVRQFDLAWQLISEIPPSSITSSSFLILIRRLISAGLTRQAIRAFHDIDSYLTPSTHNTHFHFLIDTLCKYGHVKVATELFNKNRSSYLAINVKTYTSLIYGWCKIGRRDMADRFLRDMISRGIEPNVVTYNVLLDGVCRRASLHPEERFGRTMRIAHELFDEMRHRNIEPDATTFSIVIHVCSRAHKPDMTMEKMREMRDAGLSPTLATYTSVIKCLCSCGRLEEAEKLVQEMASDGISPSAETYNCFFKEYRGRKDVDGALKLYKRMMEDGLCTPTTHTFNILVGMFLRVNRMELVRDIWDDMKATGAGPDLDSYTMMIHGLCEKKRWRVACEMFVEMIERGLLPQKVTFETLYKGLIQADMLRTWRRLKKRLDQESITFGTEFHTYQLKPYRR